MIAIVALCAGLFAFTTQQAAAPTGGLKQEISQDDNRQEEAYKNSKMDLPTYLGVHIAELSPVQETLGGKFYVTDVEARDNKGTVMYSDGHNQYTAVFSYKEDPKTGFTITAFKLKE